VFIQYDSPVGIDVDVFYDAIVEVTWKFCAIGCGIWLSHYIFVTCLNYTAERQVLRIRTKFFEAVLKQDLAWYDVTATGDFASRMTEDLNKMQDGMGEKVGMLFRFLATGIGSFVFPYIQNWLLSLVLTAIVPIMMIMGGIIGKFMMAASKDEMDVYGKAGAIADEVLSSIRTVVAFGGQKKELEKYCGELKEAKKNSIIKGTLTISFLGLMFGIIYCAYGLGFWYGCKLIMDYRDEEDFTICIMGCTSEIPDCTPDPTDPLHCIDVDLDCAIACDRFTVGSIVTAIFGILQGGMQVGQSSTYVEAMNTARAAAVQIFKVIDRVPAIDSSSTEGLRPAAVRGEITFNSIDFNYPARKDVQILNKFTLTVPAGSTVALVGPSGCGKSTCVQLVQRLYDPAAGSVALDGNDLKSLNVGWLRDNIGIVGQEPVLFDCSIRENIRYAKADASEEEIVAACKEANAYDFIQKMPKQMDTNVGEGGAQMSGGQKQRIAIARALIRSPKLLLLDEATSALDTESEAVVQEALDRLHSGRTTIVIAHRLSTVRNADLIVAIEGGQVKEMGTHNELMSMAGLYASLVERQLGGKEQDLAKPDTTVAKGKVESQVSRQKSVKETKAAQETNAEEASHFRMMGRLIAMNSPEVAYILLGCLASVGYGLVFPLFGEIFGRVIEVFALQDTTQAREDMFVYVMIFIGMGLALFASQLIAGFTFSLAGARLVERVRRSMFNAMLNQEIGWFDKEENNTGALCARLSVSADAVASAGGGKIGSLIGGLTILIACGTWAIIIEWRLGLVSIALLPALVVGMTLQIKMMMFDGAVLKGALENSSKHAVEAITNIRTVAGLRCEAKMLQLYQSELVKPFKSGKRRAHVRGLVYGLTNAYFLFAYALCYYFGAWLLVNHPGPDVTATNIMKIAVLVLNGGAMIGISVTALMDINMLMVHARKIFEVIDRKPKIDCNPSAGLKLDAITGNVDIRQGKFSYPVRPNVPVLRSLDLTIRPGEKVALVGQSGCGKSTVIQLIQRFYDVDDGSVELENHDIRSLNVPFVRSKLAIVSQEPVLFNKSIADNIRYGNNEATVSMEEVISAARKANIHGFVTALPQGYETSVGAKGTQLSGGQKQRVAIARAMVRNPSILLLDEATSALDSESEQVVQEALEVAQEGRTSITIAHRLSTIMEADRILVLERGRVAESGSHSELLAARGIYHGLWHRSTTG